MRNIVNISNVRGYIDQNQTAWLNLEDIARGLGFTQVKNGVEYVRWETVKHYLQSEGFSQEVGKDVYIPENIFYILAMKAKNAVAKKFQRFVAYEVLPTLRRTGGYVINDDLFIETYLPYVDDHTKMMFKTTLETIRKQNEQIRLMKPKAKYFDVLVERNLLTNFRDTAKQLGIGQKKFINWLLDKGYIYRDKRGRLKPYAQYMDLFKLKDWANQYKADQQTLITPKGKESFRLLLKQEGLIKDD